MNEKLLVIFAIIGSITIAALSLTGLIWIIDAIANKTRKM